MDGLWSSPDLAALLRLAARNRESLALSTGWFRVPLQLRRTLAHRTRRNTRRGARRNIAAHYDLGNDFYRLFLDETLTYSCAVFETPDQTLADAQRNKYRRIADRSRAVGRPARPGDRERVGRLRAVRGGRARLPRDDDHDLARAARARNRAGSRSGTRAPRRRPAARLPRRQRERTTRSSRSRCSRPSGRSTSGRSSTSCDRALRPGGRLSLQVITFPDAAYEQQLPRGELDPDVHLPGRPVPVARGARAGNQPDAAARHGASRTSRLRTC